MPAGSPLRRAQPLKFGGRLNDREGRGRGREIAVVEVDVLSREIVTRTGSYSSSCACRTERELERGDFAPRCPSCGAIVAWTARVDEVPTRDDLQPGRRFRL